MGWPMYTLPPTPPKIKKKKKRKQKQKMDSSPWINQNEIKVF